MSAEPSATAPAMLTSLIGEAPGRRLTAAQAVERLRLWDPSSSGQPAEKRPSGQPAEKPPPDQSTEQRPHVFLNMACTADGRATLGGRSGPIGNRADRELFQALRTAVDAVLVGGGTARAERYRRLVRDETRRRLRRERGLAEEPLACIVSASLAISSETVPLLADPAARVVILTPSLAGELPVVAPSGDVASGEQPTPYKQAITGGPATTPEQAPAIAYVRAAREGQLDLGAALAELYTRWGVRTVLCEGGPHLNGALLAAGLVDELFLTLAPKLGGGADSGAALRIVRGPEFDPPVELELLDVLKSESNLLLRYGVSR
jgi:riboflavin biosynthesis pyrimidine reductase